MDRFARLRRAPGARPLRAQQSIAEGAGPPAVCCRICWGEATDEEGGVVVSPCKCDGSMKHVHLKCLQTWQIQLRQQKGAISARRCDVCRAPWARQFARPGQRGSPHWAAAADAARALQPWVLTLARWWKVVALAQGVLHGMEAGAAGFRLGLRYHAVAAARHAGGRHDAGSLLRWAPFSVWAAGVVPPVALPAALAIFVAASSAGAVQGAVMAAAGLYAGGVAGFAHGVTQTALTSMQALSGGLGAATRGVAAGLHALLRLLTCWW